MKQLVEKLEHFSDEVFFTRVLDKVSEVLVKILLFVGIPFFVLVFIRFLHLLSS
ncbi:MULTISPECIES: hypothetical protein [Bacillus]|uniref:hypothetical protein n=1 Tax=Bacillus TaxID=1386 RepID=UPI0012FF0883|nr:MULTISPECIES: hypothetical protein [Bacillus]